jgi:hypothetical protein
MRKPKELYKILLDYLIWHDDWNSVNSAIYELGIYANERNSIWEPIHSLMRKHIPIYEDGTTLYYKLIKVGIIYELYRKS